jgi:glycosyltransferase involved in cell wall biosynthesis
MTVQATERDLTASPHAVIRPSTRRARPCVFPPKRCKVVAVIPAYNEERFIGSVVLKTRQFANQVIVVDDGSTDQTAQLARAAGALVVSQDGNHGKGTALNAGLQAASRFNPDVVVALDADGQHGPDDIPSLVAPILGCGLQNGSCTPASSSNPTFDLVIGSRYLDDNSRVPRHRIWGHWAFNLLTRTLSGERASDSQSGFRAFSRRALEAIDFSSNGFSVESEMQFIAHEHGLKISESPVTIRYSDPPKRSVVRHGLLVIAGIMRLVGQYRPLLFFGLPGLIAMLGGTAMGFFVVDIYRRTHQLAAGYAMISVLLTIVGMLGLSTGVILHSVRGLLLELLKTKDRQ